MKEELISKNISLANKVIDFFTSFETNKNLFEKIKEFCLALAIPQ